MASWSSNTTATRGSSKLPSPGPKCPKFSCRVNDNGSPARELATDRSVSKDNGPAFHDSWQTHWANELEFSAGK
jgi:hypothetical protein